MTDAAVSRLEAAVKELGSVTARLEKVASRPAAGAAAAPPIPVPDMSDEKASSPSAQAWEEYYSSYVTPFIDSAKKIGADDVANLCAKSWGNIGSLMRAASLSKKPAQDALSKFVKPAVDAISEASNLARDRGDLQNHKVAFSELVQSLGWVMVSPAPQGHVQGQLEAADFYLSKCLSGIKDKGAEEKENHRAYVRNGKEMLTQMKAYIKQWHTTGVSFTGKANLGAGGGAGVPPPAAAAAAPSGGGGKSGGGGGGFGAVLADLNKGNAITTGLKKVTRDMKTKYRENRSGLVTAIAKKKTAVVTASKAKVAAIKEPSISLARGQHLIEHFQEGDHRVPEGATIKQNVYIYKCGECVIRSPEKVKAVTVDGCKRTKIVVEAVVSTVEVVNCQSVSIIVTGKVNAFAIDKTAGCQLLLSRETKDADPDIITSNISECNVQLPGPTDDDDPTEIPVPEQFLTKINGNELRTGPVLHG